MPDNVTLDPPITNIERLLAKAAGMEGISVDEPETRPERYLKAICDRLDNGGGLPPVTESDAGKVLAVDNSGVWGAENEVFYFDVAYNLSDGSYTAQSVNREELVDAINKGKRFAMRYTDENHLTTIIDVQSFGKSSTEKSANALFIGVATISDNSDTGFTTINLFASVSPDEDPSITEAGVVALILNHDNRFIVTLTPTSPDFSGTMDKTVAEINAAYKAGQEIVFRVRYEQSGSYIETPVCVQHGSGAQNEGFFVNICYNNTIIVATTGVNPPPDRTTYFTVIYTLTPAT